MLAEQMAVQAAAEQAVYEAKVDGSVLRVGETARQIRSRYPQCNLLPKQIADIVAREAIVAGVPLQFTDPN